MTPKIGTRQLFAAHHPPRYSRNGAGYMTFGIRISPKISHAADKGAKGAKNGADVAVFQMLDSVMLFEAHPLLNELKID